MRIEVREGPNRDGLYFYTLYWTADYHPGHPEGEHRTAERGQCFLAELPEWAGKDQLIDRRGKS